MGFFLPASTFSADSLTLSAHPCVHLHALTSARLLRCCSSCQSSVDCENTDTPRRHRRLGSATLSQLAFSPGKRPEFPMGEILVGHYSCKKKKKKITQQLTTNIATSSHICRKVSLRYPQHSPHNHIVTSSNIPVLYKIQTPNK